jgi:hypothetical protein
MMSIPPLNALIRASVIAKLDNANALRDTKEMHVNVQFVQMIAMIVVSVGH